MTTDRGLGERRLQALAQFDAVDELTSRSALRSIGLAGLVVGLPALWRPDSAPYYLLQAGLLLSGTAALQMFRHRLRPWGVSRGVVVVGAVTVAVAALLSGGAASPAYHAYTVALVGGVWLVFEPRSAIRATTVILGAGLVLGVLTLQGWLPTPWLLPTPASAVFTTTTAGVVISIVQWLEMHRLKASHAAVLEHLEGSEAAQRQMALSERRHADIVSTAPGVVFEYDLHPDGARGFTYMSEGARHLFEIPPAEIVADARRLSDLLANDEERRRVGDALRASHAGLTSWEVEAEIRTPSGQTRWVRTHALPARLADGTVRWHGFVTDVSGRIQSERALRDSQAALKQSLSMLQGAFESTVDGLLVIDGQGRVSGYNQKFMALWRMPEAIARTRDVEQMRAHVMRQVTDPEAFQARVRDIYARPDAVSFDTLALVDGRHYERYSQPQVVDGVTVGRVWSFRDVTARVSDERRRAELEQALQQAHTLEALGTLAGGIAHDFNNLLTIILGNAEQAALATSSDDRDASLAAITHAADRATALVREIREFSQPRATERTVVTVADTIGSAVQLLRTTMPKHIGLEAQLDAQVTMFTSATQVQQVVTNLVVNAAQAIGTASGRITVTLDDVAAADTPETTPRPLAERYARLTVRDTGPGIAAEAMPRIFDPFFTTRGDSGSGLGLAVVNGIVRRYHGTIVVDSTPGSGTTFRVYWPALPPTTSAPAAAPAAEPGARQGLGRRILVVDDEADIVRVISEGLRRLGYVVTGVTDPHQALATFSADPSAFDAVLSDLSMPHLSGAALGRRMLDQRPDIPIVLFTGYAAELGPDEARAAGFRAVLNKPMSLAVLAESLHRVLPAPAST